MIVEPFTQLVDAASDSVVRAEVVHVNEDGSVLVTSPAVGNGDILCDRLYTGTEPATLTPGDNVLCFASATLGERWVVMGRVGPSQAKPQPTTPEQAPSTAMSQAAPEVLLLEATRELTLRVGNGSITIRADGRILIKGTDLVSHAKRMNRIKGGAVSIN